MIKTIKCIFKFILDQNPTSSVTVTSEITTFEFTGISLGKVYIVSLGCTFGDLTYACGTVSVFIAAPDLLIGTTIYTQLVVARTWTESQQECLAGLGHLVSLGNITEERLILEGVSMSDIWTGGNICPDSPGRLQVVRSVVFILLQHPSTACGRTEVRIEQLILLLILA